MGKVLQASELASRIGTELAPMVVDVRDRDEYVKWHINDSTNIPLDELEARVDEIPDEAEVVVLCAQGIRSERGSEILGAAGKRPIVLEGGMDAWGSVYDSVRLDLGDVVVVQVRRRGKGCLSYLIGSGNEAFVVDPSTNINIYTELAGANGWKVTRVFDTHLHADHVSGARSLSALTGATLHLNPADHFEFDFNPIRDGDHFEFLNGVELNVVTSWTPGHTQGSTIYAVAGRVVLTGDTLFVDGVGRPDLADRAEEFSFNLYNSLHDRVFGFRDDMIVLPGHSGDRVLVLPDAMVSATMGELRTTLSVLELEREDFVDWASTRSVEPPPSHVPIIEANMGLRNLADSQIHELELGPNRCSL